MVWLALLAPAVVAFCGFRPTEAAINRQINFQGKLVNTNGTNIANGIYNMEFKIYAGGDGVLGGGDETLVWTESRLRNNSQGVSITDSVFQVNLGSVTTLPGSVDFNNNTLWLSMNLGNTNASCTPFSSCGGDGEMTPFVRFTAAPYALNSDTLDGIDSTAFAQLAANQTWTGTQTLQPTTDITSAIVRQTSVGSPTADIFNVQTANNTNIIQVTGPAANEAAVTIQSVGTGRDITLNSADTIELLDNTNISGNLAVDTDTFFVDATTNRVGVGTATVSHKLHVTQAASTTVRSGYFDMSGGTAGTEYVLAQFSVNGTGAQLPAIAFSSNGNIGLKLTHASSFLVARIDHNYGLAEGLAFAVRGSEKFRVNQSGQVGIGTTGSDARLELAGDMTQAAWGLNGVQLQASSATYTDSNTAVSGTATNAAFTSFGTPTLAATNTGVTTTNAATVYIQGPPTAGTNQTITNAYALWIDDGNVRLDGDVAVNGGDITASGALTVASGGSSALTLNSASGRVNIATGDFLGLSVSGVSGATAGDIWYDSAAGKFKVNEGGTTKTVCNATDLGCATGGATQLDQVTAATGNASINNAANNIVWNWQLTAAETGMLFAENSASTGGGTQDQFILGSSTLAGSTASPLRVVSNSVDAADVVFDLNSAGDFEIQDAGVAVVVVDDGGFVDIARNMAVGSTATPSTDVVIGANHSFDSTVDCTAGCRGFDATVRANKPTGFASGSIQGFRLATGTDATTLGEAYTLANAIGLTIDNGSLGANTTITNNFGILINDQTKGTADYGLVVQGADTYAIWVQADATRLDGQLVLGASTDITTGTDEALTISPNGSGDTIINIDTDTILAVQNGGNTVASLTDYGTLELVANGHNTTGIGNPALLIDSTLVKDAALESFYAFKFVPTINVSADPTAFGADFLFRDATVRVLDTATAGGALTDSGGHATFSSSPTIQGTGNNNSTIGQVMGIQNHFVLSKTGTGTLTATNVYGGVSTGVANTDTTITNRYGFRVDDITGSGTVTNQYGLYVSDQTKGTTDYGLYVQGADNYPLWVGDAPSDTTPVIVDGDGRLGVGTASITGSTERLLQVGSPTNRGNAAVYGDVVSQGIADITGLTNIKDVYVYDTTADSDGGRWIDWATTDQLSWYNETLDDAPNDPCNIATDDRCYAKAFPRKAILVVTTNALYIFDAATNDMWMKFSQNAAGYALGVDTNSDPSSVTALNGVIYVGTNGSSPTGLYVLDFVNDRMWNYDTTDRAGADKGIGSRNTAITYSSDSITQLDIATVGTVADWMKINDVSAANINSSNTANTIGAATNFIAGYGQSFVALATDAGLTVINLGAQRLVQYSEATDNDYTSVHLTKRGRMYALNTSLDELERWDNYDSDKASEVNGAPNAVWDETALPALSETTPNILAGAPDALEVIERGSLADDASDIIYVGHSLGLTEIHDNITTKTSGWSKFYNTTRQTPFMTTGVKAALPMDDASGNVTDVSYATNTTDMTAVGSPTYGVSGVRGKAMAFNGTSQYLCSDANVDATCDVDTAFNMSTTGWNLTMWFKHSTTASGTDVLFDKCFTATPAAAVGCVSVYMNSSGNMVVGADDDATFTIGSSYDITATSSHTYNDNQWHQLILSRTNANDLDVFIDGQALNLSTATGLTLTFDGSQIVGIGADCSAGANCSTGTNFWDGAIDDITFSSGGTTVATLTAANVRRLYNDARPTVGKRNIAATDADAATSTTLQETGSGWIPNEFSGLIVEITGSSDADCVGVSRRVASNTSDTLTFTPAVPAACTLDTSADFEIDPEAIYGSTNSVYAVGITAEAPLGEARQMCIGTNDGSDGGGVTCYNHQAGPNIIADLFHSRSGQTDDFAAEWTGTDYDDIRAIDLSGRALLIGSEAHFYSETRDVRLGQGLDYLANQLFNIRSEILTDGITAAGSLGAEVGFTGGADLAENYSSDDDLVPGEIVIMKPNAVGSIKRATTAYDDTLLGVVATAPGLVLGEQDENSYPVALVGRVPVKVTTENGPIRSGDQITSSSIAGYGMKATKAGRVLGSALEDFTENMYTPCPAGMAADVKCGQITIFVNLVDYAGQNIDTVMSDAKQQGLTFDSNLFEPLSDLGGSADTTQLTEASEILSYLAGRREQLDNEDGSEILTDQVNTGRLNAVDTYTKNMHAVRINVAQLHANRIDGLEILTVKGPADFKGNVLFRKLVTFVEKTVFDNDIIFNGRTTFNNDTAGFAIIKKDQGEVNVKFEKPYEHPPVVTVTVKNGLFVAHTYKDLSAEGFTIVLKEPAAQDVEFAWTALSIKDVKVSGQDPPPR